MKNPPFKSVFQTFHCRVSVVVAILFVTFQAVTQTHAESEAELEMQRIHLVTIGNSFANNATRFLEEIAASVPGYEIEVSRANKGGTTMERHLKMAKRSDTDPEFVPYADGTLKQILSKDVYDVVTIQQDSKSSWRWDTFEPHADELIAYIREHAPSAEIMVHQTWAYHPYCERLKKWRITREEMHTRLTENYNRLAEQNGLEILPSGDAFYLSWQRNPDPAMGPWNHKDLYHADRVGEYLAGLVWFGKLFGVSPEKVTFVPDFLDEEKAAFFRRVATDTLEQRGVTFTDAP